MQALSSPDRVVEQGIDIAIGKAVDVDESGAEPVLLDLRRMVIDPPAPVVRTESFAETEAGAAGPAAAMDLPQPADAATADPARFVLHTLEYIDADHDGYTARASGQLCAGPALPAPYLTSANGNDCDDSDMKRHLWMVVYADKDHDGRGAGPYSVVCTDGTVPAGTSTDGTDADDTSPLVVESDDDELIALVLRH